MATHFLGRVAFEHQINLARRPGIVTTEIAADLHCIRDLRNKFAHNVSAPRTNAAALSFETRDVRSRCLAMQCVAYQRPKNPRDAFVAACIELVRSILKQRFFTPRIVEGTFGLISATPIPPKAVRKR